MPLFEDEEDIPVAFDDVELPGLESDPLQEDTAEVATESTFPEEHREAVRGLLYLGYKDKEIDVYGHSFLIRTLHTDEMLAVAQVVKDYEGTEGWMKAYATALVGAAVVSYDGRQMPDLLGPDQPLLPVMRQRFKTASRWFPHVIDVIYSEFLALEAEVQQIFEALGKASG